MHRPLLRRAWQTFGVCLSAGLAATVFADTDRAILPAPAGGSPAKISPVEPLGPEAPVRAGEAAVQAGQPSVWRRRNW
jgi:hypothetical protein